MKVRMRLDTTGLDPETRKRFALIDPALNYDEASGEMWYETPDVRVEDQCGPNCQLERGESFSRHHALDVNDFEVARSIHRVVRAMHDGECPRCHRLLSSAFMTGIAGHDVEDHVCPYCYFMITKAESDAAMAKFAPVMERNLEVFETWRATLPSAGGN